MCPIDVQLHRSERRSVIPFAGVPPVRPGDCAMFAVDLIPGVRYALVCFEEDGDGVCTRLRACSSGRRDKLRYQ